MPTCFLALPSRDGTLRLNAGAVRTGGRVGVRARPLSRSLLPHCFNLLWCGALNERPVDLWAMLHDDVQVPAGWLDALAAELDRTGADVLSAVVPIRDERGLTSTAVVGPDGRLRRLTVREVAGLPETFGPAEAGGPLLVNTGCWVCRFDAPWVERVCFREEDRVYRDAAGRWQAAVMPEDWLFSRDAAGWGLRVLATRKVPVRHVGPYGYPSWGGWGEWGTDLEPGTPLE